MNTKERMGALLGMGFNVDEAIDILTNGSGDTPAANDSPRPTVAALTTRLADSLRSTPTSEHKGRRRRYKARVGYVLTKLAQELSKGKGTKAQREILAGMFPTALDTLKAIADAKGEPVSNRQIERTTKLGKKTVESAVWHLRNRGLVSSVALKMVE